MKEIVSEEVIALFKRATQWKESKLIILIPQVEDKFRAKFTWKEAFRSGRPNSFNFVYLSLDSRGLMRDRGGGRGRKKGKISGHTPPPAPLTRDTRDPRSRNVLGKMLYFLSDRSSAVSM